MSDRTPELERLYEAARRYCNWGKWGPDDEAGTLNYITPEDIVNAARLIRKGRVFSLAIPFGASGPQRGGLRRFNPMHFMLRDGSDVVVGAIPGMPPGIGGADDVVLLATHGATHWDALAHIIFDNKMWNGYDATRVSSLGASKNSIMSYRNRIVGRGVLLDVPRAKGRKYLEPGYGITPAELDETARAQGVAVGRGDIVLVRTGHIALCRERGDWGDYAGGDAPGLTFDTLGWLYEKQVAAVASDTWGVEVRPNELPTINQPWHRVAIPQIGLAVGEIFDLEELAEDCAADGVYEFFVVAVPLPLENAVGGPVNPVAIK
jgi:kynurenine formamidase